MNEHFGFLAPFVNGAHGHRATSGMPYRSVKKIAMKPILFVLSLVLVATTTLSAQQIEGPCLQGLIKVLKTSPRVQQITQDLKEVGVEPDFLLGEIMRPKGVKNAAQSDKITIRIGIDHPEKFEPVTTLVLYPREGRLAEIDWLTGEELPLEFDAHMLKLLPQLCEK